jgi:inosine-uridine nucleoside N-ribohydrolase
MGLRFRKITTLSLAAWVVCALSGSTLAQSAHGVRDHESGRPVAREKVIIDTDIGDDIDDAFALALAVSSPKLEVLGVTTAWGDTELRARLARRFLIQIGHGGIPVAMGLKTRDTTTFTQERWAEAWPAPANGFPNAIDFMRDLIRHNPGQITLIAIAPYSNVAALLQQDPAEFHELKRIVLMGGSIHRGYGDLGYLPSHGPDAEYNVASDIPASQAMFDAGVPITMMPLDSTQLKLDEVLRATLFSQDTPVSDALNALYAEWSYATQNPTPTLYDAMAVAATIEPGLCPTRPVRIVVDNRGYTRVTAGAANVDVCLRSDSDRFFHFYISAILRDASH